MPGAIRVPTKKAPQKRGKTSEAKAPSRTKPAWNEYLTDDTRYKLTEYQKLQRQIQHMSSNHFIARSPSQASVRSRSAKSSAEVPPSKSKDLRQTVSQQVPTTLQREQPQENTKDSHESPKYLKSNSSSSLEPDLDDDSESQGLQLYNESAEEESLFVKDKMDRLEEMLADLEIEADKYEHLSDKKSEEKSTGVSLIDVENNDIEEGSLHKLTQICKRSLEIGLSLTKSLDQLSKDAEMEREIRRKQEVKIESLEEVTLSMQAKCSFLDGKYRQVLQNLHHMSRKMKDAEDTILLLTENIAKIQKPSKHQRELEFQDSQSLAPRKNSTGTTTATTETRSSSIYQKHGLGVAGFRANSHVNLAEEDKENVRNEQKE